MSASEQTAAQRVDDLTREFTELGGWEARYKRIIEIGKELPEGSAELHSEQYLVKGCQSQVWLHASLDDKGLVQLQADSDALIVKGLAAILLRVYSGLSPQQILDTPPKFIEDLGFKDSLSPSRANGFLSMIKQIMLYATALKLTTRQAT